MSSAKPDSQPESQVRNETESVAQGVTDVLNAFFDVGASLAKTVAAATANNKPVPAPSPNAAPLNAIIHYGLITFENVFNVFADGLKNRTATPTGAGGGSAQSSSPMSGTTSGSLPVVQRGGTLRIPLSIENPGNEPMQHMRFLCLAMQGNTPGSGVQLNVSAVRFQPETLTIAPRDFEKLTVFIDTGFDTLPGRYKTLIGLGGGSFEMSVEFEVLPQAA